MSKLITISAVVDYDIDVSTVDYLMDRITKLLDSEQVMIDTEEYKEESNVL